MNYKKIIIALLVLMITAVSTCIVVSTKKNSKQEEAVRSVSIENPDDRINTEKYTATPSKVSKSEAVYVDLAATGEVKTVTVSDRITTDLPNCAVKDKTDLSEIRQISSPIAYEFDGENIVWHMNSTEFIYNGKSDKPLPVSINIDYYLNGEKKQPEEIYGKAGSVTIKIRMKNNEKRTISIDGSEATVYSPFAVAGGMILTGGKYSDVTVNSGKVLSDSSKDLVVMIGFPGLNESLNLEALGVSDLSFADEFTVKMSTRSFDAGNFYFAVIPLSVIDASFALPDSLDGALEGVSKLSEIQDKLASIDIDALMKVFSSESGNNINDLILSLSGAMNLYESNAALIDVLDKYLTTESIAQLKSFFTAVANTKLPDNTALLNRAASLLGIGELLDEYKKIEPLLTQLLAELNDPEIQLSLERLPKTLTQLKALKYLLDKNSDSLATIVEFMSSDSFDALLSLMETYNENKDLFSTLTASSEELSKVVPYLEKWFNLANDYKLYSKATDDAQTEVIFVYKTRGA